MSYEIFLALHILGAIVWIGGGVTMAVLTERARRANDTARVVSLVDDSEWMGMRFFFPASLVLLVAGILLVIIGQWPWSTPWVVIGIAGFVASAVLGSAFVSKTAKQVHELIGQRGTDDPDVRSGLDRLVLLSRVDLVILLLVVLDMTLKPGT
ncbi:MAG: DUF2269 family protein [Actinomycetota bacterium]